MKTGRIELAGHHEDALTCADEREVRAITGIKGVDQGERPRKFSRAGLRAVRQQIRRARCGNCSTDRNSDTVSSCRSSNRRRRERIGSASADNRSKRGGRFIRISG